MEKLVLPDSLLYIGDRAFRGNESLHTVILGGRTKSIGAYAFASCTNLEKIEIPSSVQHIGSYAFLYTAFGNHLVNDYTGFVTLGDGVLVAYNGKEKDIVVPGARTRFARSSPPQGIPCSATGNTRSTAKTAGSATYIRRCAPTRWRSIFRRRTSCSAISRARPSTPSGPTFSNCLDKTE